MEIRLSDGQALHALLFPAVLAAAAAAVSAGLELWLGEDTRSYGPFYVAVAAATWAGRGRSGLVALAVAAVLTFLPIAQAGPFELAQSASAVRWTLFLAGSLAIVLMLDSTGRDGRRARSSEQALSALIAVAPVGIALFDTSMRYRLVNRALADMNGVPEDGHLGRTVDEVVPAIAPLVRPHFDDALRSQRIVAPIELRAPFSNGSGERIWREAWFPVRSPHGGLVGVGAVVEDITEQRRREESERTMSERKSDFLAVLGHELRTPLGAITAACATLRLRGADGVSATALQLIERQVRQMQRLTEDVFDLARARSGRLSLRRERIDLLDVLASAAEAVRHACAAKRQSLSGVPEHGAPVSVLGDTVRLRQVFYNLLQNASKYSPAGSRIELAVEVFGTTVEIRVRDSGEGIDEENLATIFDMWAQAQPAASGSGLGIGLALVKTIVEAHGGSVVASSAGKGRGALFTVRLPVCEPGRVPGAAGVAPA